VAEDKISDIWISRIYLNVENMAKMQLNETTQKDSFIAVLIFGCEIQIPERKRAEMLLCMTQLSPKAQLF